MSWTLATTYRRTPDASALPRLDTERHPNRATGLRGWSSADVHSRCETGQQFEVGLRGGVARGERLACVRGDGGRVPGRDAHHQLGLPVAVEVLRGRPGTANPEARIVREEVD